MKRKIRVGLRTQLSIAMVICVVITISVATISAIFVSDAIMTDFENSLSPAARALNNEIDAFKVPKNFSAVPELIRASQKFSEDSEVFNLIYPIAIGAASALLGIVIALILANRIGKPLEAVSVAARRVAGGDLSARIDAKEGGAGETSRLIHNFNAMARSLQRFDRQASESTASIAHELRTPLTILRGRLQGMREGLFKTDGANIDGLIAQVDSLTQIVNDLNVVSLAQAGRLDVQLDHIDIAEEIGSLLQTIAPDLKASELTLETALSSVFMDADANRLRQATLALIENVRHHAAIGRVLGLETGADEDGAFIRVLDRGPGFAPEVADRLFDPFWRGEPSRSRLSGGTGLGLSVVASIAHAHHGKAIARPREGGGAIFELKFPIDLDQASVALTKQSRV
jgi:two-component system, OmpR family, sensor histidine kinase AdeS